MAVRYWDNDGLDQDWATAGNWSGDTLPVADDVVIFDGRMLIAPTTGMTDGGSASDSGHANACTFDLLHFKKTYTGGIGTAALPLVCSPDKIIIEGTGTYYICVGKNNQSTSTAVATVIIANSDAIVYLFSNANVGGGGGKLCEFTAVYVLAGTVYASYYTAETDCGCYIKDLYMMPTNNKSSDVTITLEKDAYDDKNDVATNVYMRNGKLICDAPLGTIHQQDGTIYYGSEESTGTANQIDVAAGREQLNITLLRIFRGSFYWLPDVNSGTPTITTAWVLGGTFDAGDATSGDIAKTVTTLHSFDGSVIDLKNNKGNVTVTNWYDLGATITTDHIKRAVGSSQYDQP